MASPELMAARSAVARSVADVADGGVVLVACSGGPDSLALVGAAAWAGGQRDLEVRAVVVDHGLQAASDEVARHAAAACRALGVMAEVVAVSVGSEGGPESAARTARYAALEEAAERWAAGAVLLGHTREDQAETVLLRLARGSGARSLSAMSARSGLWRRPFLALPRADVHAVAAEVLAPASLAPWDDPHNEDRGFARVRVRGLLAGLVADLGPGVVLGLARSADQLRDDADALDALADEAFRRIMTPEMAGWSGDCDQLAGLPAAVRTRVIRRAALGCGAPADALGYDHVRRIDDLVVGWHGQGEIRLPGGVVAERACGRLGLHPA